MRSHRFVELGLGLLSAFVMTVPAAAQDREPNYRGRTAGEWAAHMRIREDDVGERAVRAFQHLGPKGKSAVPTLINILVWSDSVWSEQDRKALGRVSRALTAIGPDAVPALAAVVKGTDPPNRLERRNVLQVTLETLQNIGPDARAAIPELIDIFKDPPKDQGEASFFAQKALAKVGPAAVPALLGVHQDRIVPSRIRGAACLPLVEMKSQAKDAVSALVVLLKKSKDRYRIFHADILGAVGPAARDAVPVLIVTLMDQDREIRLHAAVALSKIGVDAGTAVPTLIEMFGDKAQVVRDLAVKALIRIGPEAKLAVPALSAGLKDPAVKSRVEAARIVLHVEPRHPEALAVLTAALKDKDGKRDAAAALAQIGLLDRATVAALADALKDQDGAVRSDAALALLRANPGNAAAQTVLRSALKDQNLSVGISDAPVLVPFLLDCMKDKDPALRRGAVASLRWQKTTAAVLTAAMNDENRDVREDAMRALLQMRIKTREMVPVLLEVLNDEWGLAIARDASINLPGALLEIGPDAVPALQNAVENKEFRHTRGKLGLILSQLDTSPRTVAALLNALKPSPMGDGDLGLIRQHVIRALAEIGPEARAALPTLIAIFHGKADGNPDEAVKAMAEIGGGNKEVLAVLTAALKEDGRADAAIRSLVILGSSSVPILEEILRNKDKLRVNSTAAANALGAIGKPGVPALIEALKDTDPGMRIVVCNALGRMGPEAKDAAPALLKLFESQNVNGFLVAGAALMRIDPAAAKKAGVK